MREQSTKNKILRFMEAIGKQVKKGGKIYLTGGATAVLLGWRESTIDIDLKLIPDSDELFQAIARLY